MKPLAIVPLILTGLSLFVLTGCDLFGDEEKCQIETTESRIWSSGRDVAYAPSDSSVSFCFNRSSNLYERSYQIENICPFGALAIKINITEKGSVFAPRPLRYRALVVERFPNKVYKIRKVLNGYRQSDNEVKMEGVVELLGLPEEGPRNYFVGVAAVFDSGTFPTLIDLENWAQENVSQVVFTANFVRYE